MQATKNTRRASKKVATDVEVKMLGAAEAAPMDADLAALLSVLEVPGAAPLVVTAAPAIELQAEPEVIESGHVESLDLSDVAETLEASDTADIVLPELIATPPSDTVLDEVIAGIEVQEHYALATADDAPIEGASAEEIAAAGVETEGAAAEPVAEEGAATVAPKAARAPRVHYQNKTDRIKARLGANLGDYLVLEIADASLEGDALKAKQDETLAVIDAMSVKVKNRASLLMDFLSGKTGKPNEILKRALDVLAADGKITTGDKGNLHINLLAKPYSVSAARAMGRNTLTVMEKTKMIVAGAKGEFLPNPQSLFLAMAQQMLNPASEPLAEEPVTEEPTPAEQLAAEGAAAETPAVEVPAAE
jgi:hypothetical protein